MEVPSHIFENFARTPRLIVDWAGSNGGSSSGGLRLTLDHVTAALQRRQKFRCIELQKQLILCAIDQAVFGPIPKTPIATSSISSSTDSCFNTGSASFHFDRVAAALPAIIAAYSLPTNSRSNSDTGGAVYGVDGSPHTSPRQLLTHNHFVNYGGTYHSYLFARLWSAQIFSKRFSADPLSRSAGQYLREHMLRHGAAGDPEAILVDMGQGPLDPMHYLTAF